MTDAQLISISITVLAIFGGVLINHDTTLRMLADIDQRFARLEARG